MTGIREGQVLFFPMWRQYTVLDRFCSHPGQLFCSLPAPFFCLFLFLSFLSFFLFFLIFFFFFLFFSFFFIFSKISHPLVWLGYCCPSRCLLKITFSGIVERRSMMRGKSAYNQSLKCRSVAHPTTVGPEGTGRMRLIHIPPWYAHTTLWLSWDVSQDLCSPRKAEQPCGLPSGCPRCCVRGGSGRHPGSRTAPGRHTDVRARAGAYV